MSARGAGVASAIAFVALVIAGGNAVAQQQADDRPLARIKKHEQELEKKIETERDRPDKKQHAKKVVNHAEDNIRGLGEQIKGAGQEIGAAVKGDQGQAGHQDRGSASPAPKKRARTPGPPSSASASPPAAGAAGASGSSARAAGGAPGAPPTPAR